MKHLILSSISIYIHPKNLTYTHVQEKDEHLELMDGILVDLLNAKWNTFVKFRFYRQFFLFCFYFVLSLISFTLRPGPATTSSVSNPQITSTELPTIPPKMDPPVHNSDLPLLLDKILSTALVSKRYPWNLTRTRLDKLKLDIVENLTSALSDMLGTYRNEIKLFNRSDKTSIYSSRNDAKPIDETVLRINSTILFNGDGISFTSKYNWYVLKLPLLTNLQIDRQVEKIFFPSYFSKSLVSNVRWNNLTEECRLMHLDTLSTKIRLTAEVLMEIAATLYIFAALREARFLGLNMFIENLVRRM